MTIRDELDDARSDGYNDGFETGFRLAKDNILKILEAHFAEEDDFWGDYEVLKDQIDQLSP